MIHRRPTNQATYDLRRLKVYSSCLRCRTKKVKCDRKEPCSRCQKHNVECSYRELTSVQLDIRQFQRHLNNPKIRKDGAGIITSTATPIIASTSTSASHSFTPSPPIPPSTVTPTAYSSTPSPPVIQYNNTSHNTTANSFSPNTNTFDSVNYTANVPVASNRPLSSSPSPSVQKGMLTSESVATSCGSPTDAESCANLLLAVSAKNTQAATDRVRIHKIHRRRLSSKPTKPVPDCVFGNSSMCMELSDINDHVDKVQLSEPRPSLTSSTSSPLPSFRRLSPDSDDFEDNNENVPIWRARAVGKHTQTAHEQDMAETFGLAAYLKAKETEYAQDPGHAGQTIDYEKELERALAQRMPSSFSRPDRPRSRGYKIGQSNHHSATPYARPSYCQLSPSSHARAGSPLSASKNPAAYVQPPPTAQCCCQIAAMQGQALGTCPYSNMSHSGHDHSTNSDRTLLASPSMSNRPIADNNESSRIAYSPSYSPSYSPIKETAPESTPPSYYLPQLKTSSAWSSSSSVTSPTSPYSSMRTEYSSPRTELAPIRFPISVSNPTYSKELEVGRDDEEPIQIECKYNEPNVDAWDMIEKPITRTVPVTTKRGRSIKMEMGWILS
ncbi:hypothetical protein FBU30_003435 [Linnemannia zychae]|nr:hypothetical protein FBU30_003435 [Linnemannia zychae]